MNNRTHYHFLFVYGTLMMSHGNAYHLDAADYLGPARTKERYPLDAANGGIPMLHDRKGEGMRVFGELYKADTQTMARCDHLEGHPTLYRRRLEHVETFNGRDFEAWIYFITGGWDLPKGALETEQYVRHRWQRGPKGDFFSLREEINYKEPEPQASSE